MSAPKRPPVLLLMAAAALLLGVGLVLWRYSRFNRVHVVNGWSVPLAVELNGLTQTIAPNHPAYFPNVPVGLHTLTVRYQGREIESVPALVRGGDVELIYNIGGAAPLVWERIAYSRHSANQQPQWKMYCGQRFIDVEDVDYPFKTPPSSISTKGGATVYKTHLTVDKGGLELCESWALSNGHPRIWLEWAQLQTRLDPSKADWAIAELSRVGDFREVQLLVEAELAARPSLPAHRNYQATLDAQGQHLKLLERYRREASDPSALDTDLYLYARLLPPQERLRYLEQALQRFPTSSWLLLSRGAALQSLGDARAALSAFELAKSQASGESADAVDYRMLLCLLELKRYPQAWALGQRVFSDRTQTDTALALARLAEVTGNEGASWSDALKPHQLRWAHAVLGRPSGTAPDKGEPAALTQAEDLISLTLFTTPDGPLAPLQRVSKTSDHALRLLPAAVRWLLLTEAWRLGDGSAARRLLEFGHGLHLPTEESALRLISLGELAPQLEHISDDVLAVLWLARARRLDALGADSSAAWAEAKRLDAFQSVVWKVARSWPVARPSAAFTWVDGSRP